MKKWFVSFLLILLLLLSGCSFKLQQDSIYIPSQKVSAIEIQREYVSEDGTRSYCKKVIDEDSDIESICKRLRVLPIAKASAEEPNPMMKMPLIVILRGKKDHHLVLAEDMAFYDQIAYEYEKDGILEDFIKLYDALDYEETEAKAEPY